MARKRRRGASGTWRFIKKQRRRRAKMHPVRRRQETVALFGGLASLPLLVFIGIPAAVFVGFASGVVGFASKASPPAKVKKSVKLKESPGMQFFTPKQATTIKKTAMRGHPCDKTCKYSTHDVKTCVCSCRGKNHGMLAGLNAGSTSPRKRKTTRRRRR